MKSRIFVGLVAGLIGGFVGWLLQEFQVDYSEMARLTAAHQPVPELLASAQYRAITLFVGGMIGLCLGSVDGVVEGSGRKLWQGMLVGALGGIVTGSIGFYAGNVVYNLLGGGNGEIDPSMFGFAKQVVARSFWLGGAGNRAWHRGVAVDALRETNSEWRDWRADWRLSWRLRVRYSGQFHSPGSDDAGRVRRP